MYLNKDQKNGLSISGLKAFIKSIENTRIATHSSGKKLIRLSLQKVESHITTAMNPFCDYYLPADPGP